MVSPVRSAPIRPQHPLLPARRLQAGGRWACVGGAWSAVGTVLQWESPPTALPLESLSKEETLAASALDFLYHPARINVSF